MHPLTFKLLGLVGAVVAAGIIPGANADQTGSPPAQVSQADVGHASPLEKLIAAAAPGATIEIPSGVYHGLLRIEKPVNLVGKGRPTLDADGSGNVLEIRCSNVSISGFLIRGTGIDLDGENVGIRVLGSDVRIEDNVLADVLFGIDCKSAPRCIIRGNTIGGKDLDIARRGDGIRLWRSDNSVIERNTIRDGRDAILWYSAGVMVRDNLCQKCRYGFHLMFSNDVTLEGNTLEANSVGVYFMYSTGVTLRNNRIVHNRGPSGYGIGLKDTDRFTIENNLIAGNRVGIYLDNSPVRSEGNSLVARNSLSTNDIGISFLPSVKGNALTENAFIDNFEQVAVLGRGELSDNQFEMNGRGNFWSDYCGYDSNADGVGESSYESRKLFENMMDREPKLRLWLFSPAQQAVEFMARAIPAVQPEPKFSDDSPLVGAAGCHLAAIPTGSERPMAIIAAALLSLSALFLGAAVVPGLTKARDQRRRAPRASVQGVSP